MNQNSLVMPMLISRHVVSDICVALVDPRVRFGENMNQNSLVMPMLISRHVVSDICVALVDPRVRFGE